MADEKTVTLTYHGPPVFSVELGREISDGDKVKDVPEGVAARLLCGSGFDGPEKLKPPENLLPADYVPHDETKVGLPVGPDGVTPIENLLPAEPEAAEPEPEPAPISPDSGGGFGGEEG